jgi:hypothetical protein
LHFLTDADGEWAEARADWCAMIDLDPSVLREKVLKMIAVRRAVTLSRVRTRVRSQPTQATHARQECPPMSHFPENPRGCVNAFFPHPRAGWRQPLIRRARLVQAVEELHKTGSSPGLQHGAATRPAQRTTRPGT